MIINKIKQAVSIIRSNPFFTGSLIMVIGTNLHNIGQLIFHFMSGKMLSQADYGDLATIISVLSVLTIVQNSFGLTIVKFISSEKDENTLKSKIYWFDKWAIKLGIFFALLTLVLSPFLIKFLNILNPSAFYLLVPAVFIYTISGLRRSIFQGLINFKPYIYSLLAEVWFKIPFALALIYYGYKVFGAMTALVVGVIFGLLITIKPLSVYKNSTGNIKPDVKKLIKFTFPVFFQWIALTAMYTVDLVLVKHFFAPDKAGVYASLAILGRIVFFGAAPITAVMFPLVAKRHAHGKPYHNLFYLSILIIGLICSFVVLFYYFFPMIPIKFLYTSNYLEGASLLWLYGLFMSFMAIAMLFTQFYLSVGKTKIVYLFIVAAVFQSVLIYLWHSELRDVVYSSLICSGLLVLALAVYFPYHDRKRKGV